MPDYRHSRLLGPDYYFAVIRGEYRNVTRLRVALAVLVMLSARAGVASAAWDGSTTLHDISLQPGNFLDINSYQFRPSEDIRWYDVENGWRVAGGSLESKRLYLFTDIRLKQAITPNLNARLRWTDEEFYAPREPERPQLELEVRPDAWPVSFSLLGAPAYAKREADLGLGATLGARPWNYVRVVWFSPDHYYNKKNDLDNSYYRRAPGQFAAEAAYKWDERYKLRLLWQDDSPLEFVLDDQVSVFAYQNRDYQASFDYQRDAARTFGAALRGFHTIQSKDDAGVSRVQDIRYYSVDGYWIRSMDRDQEWTTGIRYDDFRNAERTPATPAADFDYVVKTVQVYTTYRAPFAPYQAWELGLYVGGASRQRDYVNASVDSPVNKYFEAKLYTGWQLFSITQSSALTLAVTWNLDDLINDTFDGGAVRFRTEF